MKDITNQRFGSLTAMRFSHKGNGCLAYWVYQCACGNEHTARANTITYMAKKEDPLLPSCGCEELKRKTRHGFRKAKDTHPTYSAWHGMKNRCYNDKDKNYKWYGAIGVTICDEWVNSPDTFVQWSIANGWAPKLHIDKDIKCKELGIYPHVYSPNTCQWVNARKNVGAATNRTNYGKHPNVRLSQPQVNEIIDKFFSGIETNCSELARQYGLKSASSINRIIQIEEARRNVSG